MPLPKIAWLITVAICVIAALILLLSNYYGYAGVVLAVALAVIADVLLLALQRRLTPWSRSGATA